MQKKLKLNAPMGQTACAVEITLAELVNAHEAVRPHKCLGSRLKKWIDPQDGLGAIRAWDVTPEALHNAARVMLSAGYANGSVNRDIGALGQVYKWAIEVKRIAPSGYVSPTKLVPRLPGVIRRVDFSATEIQRLRDAAAATKDRRFTAFVWTLLDSGCRKSEALERCWRDFDETDGTLTCPTTKNGSARVLLLSPKTAKLIAALRPANALPTDLIWHGRRSATTPICYRKPWVALVESLGHAGMHIHDTRHAVAADLLKNGTTVAVAAQILGHADHTMLTRRYGHLELGTMKQAQQNRWEAVHG